MASQVLRSEEKAFLLGVAMEIPELTKVGYSLARASLEVLSTRMTGRGDFLRKSLISVKDMAPTGGVELGLPVGQGEGLEVLGDEGLRRSSDENDIVGNGGFDGGKLVDEGLSDKAGSDNSNVNSLGHGGVCN